MRVIVLKRRVIVINKKMNREWIEKELQERTEKLLKANNW